MYRCHFTQGGRIVMGQNLKALTLEDAIEAGRTLLAEHSGAEVMDGIEIWDGAALLHAS
jgi:hypothetical protein